MKKFLCLLLIILIVCGFAVALVACDKNNDVQSDGLQMNTKYSLRSEWTGGFSIRTYTFRSDGTGDLYHYSSGGGNNYRQHFVYEYLNSDRDTVMLFKTKLEYLDENEKAELSNVCWIDSLMVSKNILLPFNNKNDNVEDDVFMTYEFKQKIEKEKGNQEIFY